MRSSPNFAPVDAHGTIPLKSKEMFKFYEPLILLLALNLEMRSTASYISPNEDCDTADPEQLFKAFVNKLAMVCDSAKGGPTVTSIRVSEDRPGQVVYHIASNQRDITELDAMASFVTTLLDQVRAVGSQSLNYQVATRALLPPILRFNRPRINSYLEGLRGEAQKCLNRCSSLDDENDDVIAPELRKLLDLCPLERASRLSEPDFIRSYQTIVQHLIRLGMSVAGTHIENRGRNAREAAHKDCWSELRHMMSRLVAYPQAVKFFLLTKQTFPRLFTFFAVRHVSSSRPLPKPIVRIKSLTADSIVGRLTSRDAEIETFRAFVRDLQLFELDARIAAEFTRPTFRPVVHSEALLLNELEFSPGGINPSRFFGGWKYIGSSKPTCKLCSYYFQEHGSGVGHRSSHGNLYSSWRLPDVRADQGLAALESRATMRKKMLDRVRKDAFDLVKKRAAPTHRSHDSVTSSARVTLEQPWSTTSRAADDVASMFGELGLDDGDDDAIGGARL